MIQIVIFDMDDTLYDEIDYCKSGYHACSNWLSTKFNVDADQIYTAMLNEFNTGNRNRIFNSALDISGINRDSDLITELVQIYRNHKPAITLPPASKQVLESLNAKYTLALLTDGFLPAQQLKVAALDIEKYFQTIIYTEQLGRQFWKPSPVGFEKIMTQFNAKPHQCVYIADNAAKDFIAPNNLGFATIQLTRKNRVHTDTPPNTDAMPQTIVTSIEDIITEVENI